MIRFHAIMTYMFDELGHKHIYQQCFRSAISRLGFAHKGYVDHSCRLQNLPEDWERCLKWKEDVTICAKISQLFTRARCFAHIFRQKKLVDEKRIFFLESFNITDLIALTYAWIRFSKPTDHLWLILRTEFIHHRLKERFFSFFAGHLKKKLGSKLTLMCDSTRLQHYFGQLLNHPVHLIPFPHMELKRAPSKPSSNITLWWPGRPDLEKGADKIETMSRLSETCGVEIYLSSDAKKQKSLGNLPPHFKFVNPILTREEYKMHFNACDAVLLPYNPKSYYAKSSSILVESVSLMKPPFVVEGSWLANELRAHNLTELILDWESPHLFRQIVDLLNEETLYTKLRKMRAAYLAYHSLPSFTHTISEFL